MLLTASLPQLHQAALVMSLRPSLLTILIITSGQGLLRIRLKLQQPTLN